MYKITNTGNDITLQTSKVDVKLSLSRTGGQGAKGDSISNVYVDVENNLLVDLSNSAGQVLETVNVGSIDTLVERAVKNGISSAINLGTHELMTLSVNSVTGALDIDLDAEVEAVGDTLVLRDSEGAIHASTIHIHNDVEGADESTEGTLSWNNEDGTLDMVLKGENVTLQVGQEQVAYVYNTDVSPIMNGKVVYIDGASSGRMSIGLADASSETTSQAIGVTTETIAAGGYGYVTTNGLVRDIDTSAFAEGAALYLGYNGELTDVENGAPNHIVQMGFVVKSHATEGTIYVTVKLGSELEELHNVQITNPQTGDMLVYDGIDQLWKNADPDVTYATDADVALKSDIGHTHSLDDLSDVSASNAFDNQVLQYNSDYGLYIPSTIEVSHVDNLQTELDNKSDITHLHDDRYYTETEIDSQMATKSDVTHLHDDRYYTETEIDSQMATKSDVGHTHVKANITDFSDADYATAAQGLLADSAIQAGDNVSELVNDAAYLQTITEESLTDLNDVTITTVVNGQVLKYNTTSSLWENVTLVKADISDLNEADYEPADATILKDADIGNTVQARDIVLDNISDLNISNNQFIFRNSSGVISTAVVTDFAVSLLDDGTAAQMRGTLNVAEAVNDLTDVEITSVADNDILQYNTVSGKWENVPLSGNISDFVNDANYLADSDIGVSVQAYNASLTGTNATFTGTLETKIAGIETGAQVNTVDSVNGLTGTVVLDTDDISDNLRTNKWFTTTERNKLSNIEAFADVTDENNVRGAGAVMYNDTGIGLASFVVDEDDMLSNSATKLPTQQSVKAYVDNRVVSSVDYRGGYNASTNTPDLDVSPSGVTKGDMYTVTVAGNFFTTAVEVGDVLIAEIDNAATVADWTIVNKNLDAASIKTAYESNAVTSVTQATKFTTARDITLSGVVAGTVSFDGTTDANIIVSSNFTLDDVTNVTETGKATGDYLRWTGTTWEGDTVSATNVTYSNVDSALESTTVKSAIDELSSNKLNVSALNSTLTVYPTTASSTISGYAYGATSTTDTNYNTTAVNVSTGVINGQNQLISSIATEEGVLSGDTGVVVTSTMANVRRTAGTGTATFYYEVYHRTAAGVETLLAESSETDAVDTATYAHYSATAIISGGTSFTATDRVVIKWYANQKTTSDPTYEIQFGGADPARTIVPVPISSLATLSTAASVSVDTGNFTGYLAGTDANVQAALEQLDNISGSSTDVASTLVERDANNSFDITGIDFTTSHSLPNAVGRFVWNNTDGTLDLGLKGGNVNLQLGQEIVVRVFNNSGASIGNGKVVALTGAVGGIPSIVLADADVEEHGHVTIGIATETIANNAAGFVTLTGIVRDINTSAFSEGDELYVSQTAGVITNVKPSSVHVMHLGTVVVSDASTGSIFVQPQQPLYDDLWRMEDVSIGTQVEGDILVWNNTTGVWENKAQSVLTLTESQISDLQGYSLTSHNHTLDSLSNVTITGASADEFLKWNGAAWVNAAIPQINSLNDVGDVNITSVQAGQTAVYNNSTSKFENKTVTVTLTGDVTGTASMDSDGNVSVAATTVFPNFNITGTTLTITNS